jgi:core-2/I-Branching enzyme
MTGIEPPNERRERASMNVAYFIMLHKLERQFDWLFSALWNPSDLFLIHVNRTAPQSLEHAIKRRCANLPNVRFLPRVPIAWGGWSLVETTLDALRLLCQEAHAWRYFINLSGQDYPVRPLSELREFLHKHDGQNFLEIRDIATEPFHVRRRLHWYCVERYGRLQRLPIPNVRALLSEVHWYGGFWGILARDFCEWLLESELTEMYRQALRHTKIPDEFFFQTLLMRSPFANSWDPNPRRYSEFEPRSPGPKILTAADLPAVTASSAFFARKFDETVDPEILRQLASAAGAPEPLRSGGARESRLVAALDE